MKEGGQKKERKEGGEKKRIRESVRKGEKKVENKGN